MNLAHVHLLLNHLPVIGTAFGLLVLAAGMIRKSPDLTKAALVVFVLMALIAVPTYLTGEPAEKVLQPFSGAARGMVETHEDMATIALGGIEVLGVLALLALVVGRRVAPPRWLLAVSLVVAVVICGLMAYTANLGGRIRHTEISGESVSAPVNDVHAAHED